MQSKNIYRLPFEGNFEIKPAPFHYEENWLEHAVDFAMPVGTPVLASLDGIVDITIDRFGTGGPSKSYLNKSNVIRIKHPNNEYSFYVHLRKGFEVKKCDKVKKGMLIAYSGDSGYNTYQHLHFHVMMKINSDWQTIPARFQIGDEIKILRSPKE